MEHPDAPRQGKHRRWRRVGLRQTGSAPARALCPPCPRRARAPRPTAITLPWHRPGARVPQPSSPRQARGGFGGSTKQLCLIQQKREGNFLRRSEGDTRVDVAAFRHPLSSQGAELSPVPRQHGQIQSQEPAKKKNQEPSKGTANRFAQPVASQTVQAFTETQKVTGVVFFKRKPHPSRAEHARAQPEDSAHGVTAALRPLLPQQQLQLWRGVIQHPSAGDPCRNFALFAQLNASPRTASQNQGPTWLIYILILCPAIRATLGRGGRLFREYCAVQPPDSCCHSKNNLFIC